MIVNRENILCELDRNIDALRSYSVRRIGLFGSVARDQGDAESDLDFLVELNSNTFRNYMGLKFYLEDLFDRKVDLAMEGSLKEKARSRVSGDISYVSGL